MCVCWAVYIMSAANPRTPPRQLHSDKRIFSNPDSKSETKNSVNTQKEGDGSQKLYLNKMVGERCFNAGPTSAIVGQNFVSTRDTRTHSQQTRYIDSMLVQCWATVFDAVPTLNQHSINVSRLLDSVVCCTRRDPLM